MKQLNCNISTREIEIIELVSQENLMLE